MDNDLYAQRFFSEATGSWNPEYNSLNFASILLESCFAHDFKNACFIQPFFYLQAYINKTIYGDEVLNILFFRDLAAPARQEAQVLNSLLVGLDGFERNQESKRLWAQLEQYLEDIIKGKKTSSYAFVCLWRSRGSSLHHVIKNLAILT